jgi:Protein of unknown function (DUF1203)
MTTILRARIAPIAPPFLAQARSAGTDALGQPVKRVIAQGGEPCRDVLRRAKPGEPLLLASYSPFARPGPYREYGPIYVLAEASDEAVHRDALPVGSETDYLRGQFAIRAYSFDEEIVDASLVAAEDAQQVIDRFLAREDVAFLHARFPSYGCFACRIERA